ncbi:hypothetical protein QQP08_023590 [Theobroma cacao]|nr:hypothetical protein QQP08_023287 [Theobroma cacao]WRX31103.1 hypothetical protein QQP08_023590 [Theobroma cacao]
MKRREFYVFMQLYTVEMKLLKLLWNLALHQSLKFVGCHLFANWINDHGTVKVNLCMLLAYEYEHCRTKSKSQRGVSVSALLMIISSFQ